MSSYFYPRPPRGGRLRRQSERRCQADFYPRPPRGGRPVFVSPESSPGRNFYPRPPRGGRLVGVGFQPQPLGFLSTPSARRATASRCSHLPGELISIHALREEGDAGRSPARWRHHDFYPRPPRGGRQLQEYVVPGRSDFYPRPPRGGRHLSLRVPAPGSDFYPRPPRGGRLVVDIRKDANAQHFYPRPPRGGRLRRRCSGPPRPHISIHALREEGDPRRRLKYHVSFISIHALREEGDSGGAQKSPSALSFLSTPSARRATGLL